MSLLDEFNDPRLAPVKQLLGNTEPTAVWYATGVKSRYSRSLDPRTHCLKVRAGDDSDLLKEKLQGAVFSDPGLYALMSYTRDQIVRKFGDTRLIVNVRDGIYCVMADEARKTSVVALLGVSPLVLSHLGPSREG